MRGDAICVSRSDLREPPLRAARRTDEWNAQATGSRRARTSRSAHHATAPLDRRAASPRRPSASGALTLATTTSTSASSASSASGAASIAGHRAALLAGASSRMKRPRASDSSSRSSSLDARRPPPARRTRRSCGRRPSPARRRSRRRHGRQPGRSRRAPAGRRACRSAPASRRFSSSCVEDGRREDVALSGCSCRPASTRSPRSNCSRTSGKTTASSRAHVHVLRALAREQERDLARRRRAGAPT